MASICAVCQTGCIFKRRPNSKEGELFGCKCDGCKRFMCKDCGNLSTTETDALLLQNKSLLFFCMECKACFPEINNLSKHYDQLSDKLVLKEKYISNLETDIEDLKAGLKQEIDRLTEENEMKERHIKRLERRTQTLDDEVFEAEKNYLSTIDFQKLELKRVNLELADVIKSNQSLSKELNTHMLTIEALEREIMALNNSKSAFECEITSLRSQLVERDSTVTDCKYFSGTEESNSLNEEVEEINSLKVKVNELQMLKVNMLTSIQVLTSENDFLCSVNKKLNSELFIALENQKNVGIESETECVGNLDCSVAGVLPENIVRAVEHDATTVSANHKLFCPLPLKKVLIYGDHSATNCSISLNRLLNKQEFLVEGWVKSKATFGEISRSVFDHTRKYGEKDYVVVMLDLNNLSSLRKRDLETILLLGKFTNLVLCIKFDVRVSVIYKRVLNCIDKFNLVNNISINVFENVKNKKFYWYKRQKLCASIADYILSNKSQNRIVLKTITIHDSLTDVKKSIDFHGEHAEKLLTKGNSTCWNDVSVNAAANVSSMCKDNFLQSIIYQPASP